jgi:putative acetyltransferase
VIRWRIRSEEPGDEAAIRAVHDEAFGGPAEGLIVDAVRAGDRYVPTLSLVAEDPFGRLLGHVLYSVAELTSSVGTVHRVLALGPVAVVPDRQRSGIGGALVHAGLGRALEGGWPLVVVLGHETYYPRFGFRAARTLGLEPPEPWPDAVWMALRLPGWLPEMAGRISYPPAFGVG